MVWNPETMTDSDLKAEAMRLRSEANGYWISLIEWAHEHGYARGVSDRWVKKGLIQGVKRRNVWYVWSTDLDNFVPPGELPRQTRQKGAA
jgi:hypothetical protein